MLVRGLDAWQVAERGRFMPWLAVFMGTGVLGYFALRVEPPLWLGASVVVPLVCASLLLRKHHILRAAVIALAATAIGFTSGQFATVRAPLPAVLPTHATIVAGTVRSVEALPVGRRVTLEAIQLDGGAPLRRWLRLRLRNNDPQEIAAATR